MTSASVLCTSRKSCVARVRSHIKAYLHTLPHAWAFIGGASKPQGVGRRRTMAHSQARLRPCLLWGIGLTLLVILLFQFRYNVTQVIFHPRRFRGLPEAAAAPTILNLVATTDSTAKSIPSAAPPDLKGPLSGKARYVDQLKLQRVRKKGRSSIKLAGIIEIT